MTDLFASTGDPAYKYAEMITRRRVAALCGQYRVVQRFDKMIALLRADLGLPPLPPEEVIRTHVIAKDPTENEDLEIAGWDSAWSRRVTATGVHRVVSALDKRGYSISRRVDGGVTELTATGSHAGQKDVIQLRLIGNATWCVSASRNGERLKAFDFAEAAGDDRGIPAEIASDNWDHVLTPATAQAYARSWATVAQELKL